MLGSTELVNLQDELSGNGTGTVVVRSPKGSQPSLFRDQSSWVLFELRFFRTKLCSSYCSSVQSLNEVCIALQSSSTYASFEDASTSGTVVLRSQHDDSDSPQTPRSRLGLNNRYSNASLEDSATNLAEVLLIFYLRCQFYLYVN